MAKKLKVWLNNKLNKRLRCTVVIKFYCIFITELVLTFFVFKCPNYFEFPKCGKRSPHLKILEIPGGRGVIKDPWNRKSWGGGGIQIKESSVVGVWISSGTTHSQYPVFFIRSSRLSGHRHWQPLVIGFKCTKREGVGVCNGGKEGKGIASSQSVPCSLSRWASHLQARVSQDGHL